MNFKSFKPSLNKFNVNYHHLRNRRCIYITIIILVILIISLFIYFLGEILCLDPYYIDGIPFYSCPISRIQLTILEREQDDYIRKIDLYSPIEWDKYDKNMSIFDVGSNIGLFSHRVAKKFPNSKVYSFEPSPVTYEVSLRNKELHFDDGMKNVNFYNFGLTSEENGDGEIEFRYYKNFAATSGYKSRNYEVEMDLIDVLIGDEFLSLGEYFYFVCLKIDQIVFNGKFLKNVFLDRILRIWDYEVLDVKMITLSSFLHENREEIEKIDILKIDTEGAEVDILKGINDDDWDKIGSVLIETHTVFDEETQTSKNLREEVDEILESRGFVRFWDNFSPTYQHGVLGFVYAYNPEYDF